MGKAIIIPDLSFSINIGTVNIIESENIDVTSISITDKPTSITNSVQLIASVLPSNATNKVVIWSSSNTSIANVNSTGLVTVIAAGTVTITATPQADSSISDSANIICSLSDIAVTSIEVTGLNSGIVGDNIQLTASILPSNATNKVVTWSSSSTSIATVNSSGLVTVISAGTVTITATSQADNTKSGSITIQCSLSDINVTSVTVSGSDTASVGGTVQLTASILPSNATNNAVTWFSSNTSVATVDSNGLVTAITAGTVIITATSQADNTKSDSITITITYSQEYPQDGLILKLDATGKQNSDSNATIWEDQSGNGNDFNLTNFEMTTSDGWDGTALVFKGTGTGLCRSISTLINGGFSTNGAITFFCKVMIMTNGRRTVFDATGAYDGGSVNDNYSIDFNYGFFSIISKETRPTNKAVWSTPDLKLSKLIGVVKQNTTTNKIEMHNTSYGEGSNTAKNTYSILQPSSTARHMQIGLLGNTYGRMDGKIYDIMLYDRELTDLEITQVVNYLTTK